MVRRRPVSGADIRTGAECDCMPVDPPPVSDVRDGTIRSFGGPDRRRPVRTPDSTKLDIFRVKLI